MIAIISPARNTQLPQGYDGRVSRPLFMDEAMELVGLLRAYSPWQLESLLDVPPKRAFDFYDDYQGFDPAAPGTPALLSYLGAAYRNMGLADFGPEELDFAQDRLCIISALYGMLRPLDGILPHRLGLKKDFSPGGQNLHAWWGDKLYRALFRTGQVVVNLASLEYAKLVVPYMGPKDSMVTCRFLVDKPGGARGAVSAVRAARGLMVRYLVQNRITEPEGLQGFDADGYRFAPACSAPLEYVFIKRRPQY